MNSNHLAESFLMVAMVGFEPTVSRSASERDILHLLPIDTQYVFTNSIYYVIQLLSTHTFFAGDFSM